MNPVVNFVGYQVVWLACIFGGAYGVPWAGVASALAWSAWHLHVSPRRGRVLALLALAGAVGYAGDSALVITGQLDFPESARLGGPSTLWMVALWVSFATTLDSSLRWFAPRRAVSAAFGAVGGPLAYFAGERLGAVTLGDPLWLALGSIGVEWLVAFPLLFVIQDRLLGPPPAKAAEAPEPSSAAGADSPAVPETDTVRRSLQ